MTEIHHTTRYCWVHTIPDDNPERINVSSWVSPDARGKPFPDIDTPHQYRLTRNDVVYIVESEVLLSQSLAIRIAGTLYDAEFIIAPKTKMKSRK
jgi:hypothetical protein